MTRESAVEAAQPFDGRFPQSFFSRFDRVVALVLLVLVAGIALTVALGDNVGVTLIKVAPLGTARSTSPVSIQFSEAMNRDSVGERLRLEPAQTGEIAWNGSTLLFHPDTPLKPGQGYTVVLEKGATSEEGRAILSEYRFSFTVRSPRVAYLLPADATPQNIWIADPTNPDSAQQVTFSPGGIYDFGVSPDGSQIAFAEHNSSTNTADIKLLDLETGSITQLTNCPDSDCTTPVWRPDGRTIAYNRVDYNSDLASVGSSPTRVWLIDLTQTPPTTRPLFADLQILGYEPQWSADGTRIAVFNRDEGVLIYDFETNNISVVPSRSGSTGAFSPDGTKVVYPEFAFAEGQEPRSNLRLADLETEEIRALTEEGEPLKDDRVTWSPNGDVLAIARRYLDERF